MTEITNENIKYKIDGINVIWSVLIIPLILYLFLLQQPVIGVPFAQRELFEHILYFSLVSIAIVQVIAIMNWLRFRRGVASVRSVRVTSVLPLIAIVITVLLKLFESFIV